MSHTRLFCRDFNCQRTWSGTPDSNRESPASDAGRLAISHSPRWSGHCESNTDRRFPKPKLDLPAMPRKNKSGEPLPIRRCSFVKKSISPEQPYGSTHVARLSSAPCGLIPKWVVCFIEIRSYTNHLPTVKMRFWRRGSDLNRRTCYRLRFSGPPP